MCFFKKKKNSTPGRYEVETDEWRPLRHLLPAFTTDGLTITALSPLATRPINKDISKENLMGHKRSATTSPFTCYNSCCNSLQPSHQLGRLSINSAFPISAFFFFFFNFCLCLDPIIQSILHCFTCSQTEAAAAAAVLRLDCLQPWPESGCVVVWPNSLWAGLGLIVSFPRTGQTVWHALECRLVYIDDTRGERLVYDGRASAAVDRIGFLLSPFSAIRATFGYFFLLFPNRTDSKESGWHCLLSSDRLQS